MEGKCWNEANESHREPTRLVLLQVYLVSLRPMSMSSSCDQQLYMIFHQEFVGMTWEKCSTCQDSERKCQSLMNEQSVMIRGVENEKKTHVLCTCHMFFVNLSPLHTITCPLACSLSTDLWDDSDWKPCQTWLWWEVWHWGWHHSVSLAMFRNALEVMYTMYMLMSTKESQAIHAENKSESKVRR